jgi:EAL domain-containing protein (putative c-di-GMP-specific phosphodiesterase class I)
VVHAPAQEGIVLKEFRSLIEMLDGLDEEPPAVAPPAERAAAELPQSIEPQPSPAAERRSSTFIYDREREHAEALAAMLWSSRLETEIFTETSALVRGLLLKPPSMVFLEVDGQGDGAIDALFALGERNYAGGVQLMGTALTPVLDVVKRMGDRHSLNMLPALRKPLRESAVRQVLATQKLASQAPSASMLDEALTQDWIEFWYQPKIDLARRQISGVETFARVRHPELGTLPPAAFMRGATEADLLRLTERALKAALGAASHFSQVGISLRLAVNVPVRALFDLPVIDLVRELGPRTSRWPGLLLDVTVDQLAADFARVRALGPGLVANNIQLAIDDFGKGNLAVAGIEELPVAELKLDRSFVNGCAGDAARARVCRGVISLAHRLGCIAVAVGIEELMDLRTIGAMGCDLGQGFLFGQPMPEEELVGLLMERAVTPAPANRARSPEPVRPSSAAAGSSGRRRATWS